MIAHPPPKAVFELAAVPHPLDGGDGVALQKTFPLQKEFTQHGITQPKIDEEPADGIGVPVAAQFPNQGIQPPGGENQPHHLDLGKDPAGFLGHPLVENPQTFAARHGDGDQPRASSGAQASQVEDTPTAAEIPCVHLGQPPSSGGNQWHTEQQVGIPDIAPRGAAVPHIGVVLQPVGKSGLLFLRKAVPLGQAEEHLHLFPQGGLIVGDRHLVGTIF